MIKKELWVACLALAALLGAGCATDLANTTGPTPATSSAVSRSEDLQIYFTNEGDHPEQHLIDVIHAAHRSLDIAIYTLTQPDIVSAIEQAKKRGVNVRILTDKVQSEGESQKQALRRLEQEGIPVKINRHSGIMHMKVTIADQQVVTTGSFNYTTSASTKNDENLVVIRNANDAEQFEKEFEKMWADTQGFASLRL